MSVEGILPAPSKEEYWKRVADLRGQQVQCLLGGNMYMFSVVNRQLNDLEVHADCPIPAALSQDNRQNLADALATITKAVKVILD